MRRILLTVAACAFSALASTALAADIGISADKLLIIDKTAVNGTSKVIFVSHDPNISKGTADDPAEIEATLHIYYDDAPANDALFRLPSPWLKNKPTVAKYLNKNAPTGGGVKVGLVKPTKLAKVIARSLGDLSHIDIASPPGTGITVMLTITDTSDGSTERLCTNFTSIEHKAISGGTGHKLKAEAGTPVTCQGGTTILMQPDLPSGFFSMPWPNDTRVNGDGTIDLSGYPGRTANAIFNLVLTNGSTVTKGFGTNSAIFLQAPRSCSRRPSPRPTTRRSPPPPSCSSISTTRPRRRRR